MVVRNASSLSPDAMAEEKQASKMKFRVLAERLFKLKWSTADETDDAKLQYKEFVDSECLEHRKICHIRYIY